MIRILSPRKLSPIEPFPRRSSSGDKPRRLRLPCLARASSASSARWTTPHLWRSRPRTPKDYGRAEQADERSRYVPRVGPDAFHDPQPQEGAGNVDTSIRRERPACIGRVHSSQADGEQRQTSNSSNGPPRRAPEAKPGPKRETPRDLEERGEHEEAAGGKYHSGRGYH